jgi:hypothetical protein
MVRSPVNICLGTSPIQAEKTRPLANAAPLPIAATIALEMIGPIPGTVMTLRQLFLATALVNKLARIAWTVLAQRRNHETRVMVKAA